MDKMMEILKTKKTALNKYEVSLIGVMAFTLLPTVAILGVQAFIDSMLNSADRFSLNNYRIYLVTALVFLAMLTLSGIICKRYAREIQISGRLYYFGCGIIFLLHLLLLAKCYLNSPTVYPAMSGIWFPWHGKTNWKMFVFMTGIAVAGSVVFLWTKKKRKLIEVLRYPAYLAASVMAGVSMYCGNFLISDKLHGNSYYTSVYNAVMGAPYDYSNRSIYGHYAIFLKYPIKLFGGDYTAFNIVISIVGGLSVLMLALALDLCLKNHFICIIGVWSIPMMYFYYPLNHWQMFPHRVLFAGIEIYLIAWYFHKKSKWAKPAGYVVCSLSLLWNMETGIVCLGVWAFCCIVYENIYAGQEKISWKALAVSVLKNMADSILAVFGMVGLFNLYNMPLGEGWHGLRFLLFPHLASWDMPDKLTVHAAEQTMAAGNAGTVEGLKLLNSGLMEKLRALDGGFTAGLSISFPVQISSWYFVFILLGAAIILFFVRKLFKRTAVNDYVMALTAVLALGQLVYFINRPCFDYLAIAFFEAVLIMGIFADETADKERITFWTKLSYQCLFVGILSVLSVLSMWQIIFRISDRADSGYYEREELDGLLNEIRETVPENTMAFGQGIQEIYAELGWDTGCYLVDFSSLSGNDHSLATIIVEASEQSECVISVRWVENGEKITAQQYMGYWGFPEEAITIKKQWDMGMDFGGSYWDIYYIGIDNSIENPLIERFGQIYRTDRSTRWRQE